MKFRSPKTGAIYDFESRDCVTRGFCRGVYCQDCPIRKNRGEMGCSDYVLSHPHTAACLMGYEVIEDDAPTPECKPMESVNPQNPLPAMISEIITGDELLRQTAEEAAELAQAALKVIRAAKERPTSLDGEAATDMLIEKIAAVQNCIAVLAERLPNLKEKSSEIAHNNMLRWKEYLERH